uniref:Utrophin n=1 Tax=Astyanax mexicanus TaxID=7994 RepID=W5K083_ASTMX
MSGVLDYLCFFMCCSINIGQLFLYHLLFLVIFTFLVNSIATTCLTDRLCVFVCVVQVKDIMKAVMSSLQQTNSEKTLLSWVRHCTRNHDSVNVLNFTTSWADGLAFNAILHHFRPHGFSWEKILAMSPVQRLDHAFTFAKNELNIEKLLDPEDVAVQLPDKKSILMYVTSLFAVLPNDVTMDDIREVETLPRKYKVDESQPLSSQEVGSTPSTVTEVEMEGGDEMDLESYQVTLEEVLTWLLSAEDALHIQDEVSDDVEEVKDQFHTHEAFMMELTAHQSSVGNVLQAGNQLIAQGNLSEDEEEEIRLQMGLLNSRWENLRVASMDRQARLHEVLMDLQQQQLQQLSDWLLQTEGRIRKMETELMAGDMEGYLSQIEQHKVLQNDLEAEQVKVNSLTHMVVVVDENSGESATAALEDQLQSLGERWAAVCRWTEERWSKLEEILLVWQQLLDDQNLFRSWLMEKENALSEVQTCDFKDPSELNTNVRRLANLKEDMAQKRRVLGALTEAGQDVTMLLKNPESGQRIETDTEELTQRWDNLVQRLEDCSNQVTLAVTVAGMPQVQERVVMETVSTVVERFEHTVTSSDRELPPPAPPKRRHLDTDTELSKLVDTEIPELLSWLATWKNSAQALSSGEPPDLKTKLQVKKKKKKAAVTHSTMSNIYLPVSSSSAVGSVRSEWEICQKLLKALQEHAVLLEKVAGLSFELQVLDHAVVDAETWLSRTAGLQAKADQPALHALRDDGQAQLAGLLALSPRLEDLSTKAASLTVDSSTFSTFKTRLADLAPRHKQAIQQLKTREQEISAGKVQSLLLIPVLCAEIEQQQQTVSNPAELQRWTQLSISAADQLGMLQCILGSMKDTQVQSQEVTRWLDAVEELLSRDSGSLSQSRKLQEELNQYKECMGEMETVESSLKQMGENVAAVQQSAVSGLATWGQEELDGRQKRWETLSKEQLLKQQEQVSESQERALNLRKDLVEMREWMTQVDEEFLMRDFEYKSPEELEEALQEMKRAKEDVLQKEVRVKILKDSINVLMSKAPPGGQDLSGELTEVLKNYHKLCDRFKSKCHTLEEVWSCWIELLQYLDVESGWLNSLEENLQAAENLPENTEAVNQALESLESVLRHPGDNRTQIRELGQTLIDGGILDELISEKLENFNSRYDELSQQAVARQMALEQKLAALRENESALQGLQESLTQLDQTLTSYLTDRIDAFQLPEEAQAIQAEITAHEASFEDLRKRNVASVPAAAPEGKPARGGTMLDQLQRKLREINTKFQLFQKPANFEQRMLDCKRVLENARAELHVLDLTDTQPEEIQTHLSGCMKLYKMLSEVKLEVETVIKTGRQIVQKQQTENPKSMDEQLTALKLLYNELGAQVTEGKQELEKALALSQKLHKDSAALQVWMNSTQTQLEQKINTGDMPADIDAEIAWTNGLLKESDSKKADLSKVMENSAALQALVEGSESQLEDQLFVLNEGWERVRTLTEDWLSAVLNHQSEVEMFDENLAHISTWVYQTEIRLDETEKLPAAERETVVKALLSELEAMSVRVDGARDQAVILMTSRGPACRELVEPKLADLNRNFHKVAQHIKTAQLQQKVVVLNKSAAPVSFSEQQEFEEELQAALGALEHQDHTHVPDDDKLDEEKARVEEMLRRGEEVLLSVPEENREEIRLRLQLLQTRYREIHILRTRRVVEVTLDSSSSSHSLASSLPLEDRNLSVSPSAYLLDVNKVLLAMADNELLLNSSELSSGLYEDFSSQEDTLRNIKDSLERLGEQVTLLNERQPDVIQDASRQEVVQIGDALTQLNAEWDRVNRMFNQRKGSFDRAVEEWRQFHCDMNDLSQWLTDTEQVLADGTGPDGELDLEQARAQQEELEEGLANHQSVLAILSRSGERIIGQLSSPDGPLLQNKLDNLSQRWRIIHTQLSDRRRRLMVGDPAVLEVVQRSADLAHWLEQTEVAVATLPVSATDKNLQELKALAEEMDLQNESLTWLNRNGTQILAKSNLTSHERDVHTSNLRQINMNWSKVTRELLDKVGEVESRLQSDGQFQDRMTRLGDWLYLTHHSYITHSEQWALETSMRERKRELEELLARSIELQRRQLLLPQEKSKIEQLAADWKVLDVRLKETAQVPLSPWTHQYCVFLYPSVLSDVQRSVLLSEAPLSADSVSDRATELADWLQLIQQMLKSSIVTVGDTDEIRTTISRLEVTKADLEQRHPQLEDIFTLAQNIKNKTSDLDVRTSITEKLEKVRSQWDATQHGVEARLLQLDRMITHSDQWEDQRGQVNALIGQNEACLHNLLQMGRDPLTKQIGDNKAFLQDLSRDQLTVATFNELCNQLLEDYSADDTRRVKEVMDKHITAWNSINNRASDRQAVLDSELKSLQASLRELESFLKWLQEAETTVNVLADASQREGISQDSAHIRELKGQLQDIQAEIDAHNDVFKSVEGNKVRMVKALGSSEEAVFLQQRLDDMNQRWNELKAKSANIRAHLEASAERWSRLLSVLEELWRWICMKDDELTKQMPIGGDVPTLLQQHNHCSVSTHTHTHTHTHKLVVMFQFRFPSIWQ